MRGGRGWKGQSVFPIRTRLHFSDISKGNFQSIPPSQIIMTESSFGKIGFTGKLRPSQVASGYQEELDSNSKNYLS